MAGGRLGHWKLSQCPATAAAPEDPDHAQIPIQMFPLARDEPVTRNASAHVITNECPFPTCFFGERGREKAADWTMRVEISIV
jgi:hypothetical protein